MLRISHTPHKKISMNSIEVFFFTKMCNTCRNLREKFESQSESSSRKRYLNERMNEVKREREINDIWPRASIAFRPQSVIFHTLKFNLIITTSTLLLYEMLLWFMTKTSNNNAKHHHAMRFNEDRKKEMVLSKSKDERQSKACTTFWSESLCNLLKLPRPQLEYFSVFFFHLSFYLLKLRKWILSIFGFEHTTIKMRDFWG